MIEVPGKTRIERIEFYTQAIARAQEAGPEVLKEFRRELCKADLFYLFVHMLRRTDGNNDWVFERCEEVQRDRNGYLDLWAREHYKSSIITLAMTIQDILIDPEITVCLFSYTRPMAKKPLKQIMNEFEGNEDLKQTFDDVLWENPRKEAPRWSLDDGIVVKRKGNPKESTVEAWGMSEGLPTGSHFRLRMYDDVIDQRATTNPDMVRGVIEQWELSLALGTRGGQSRYVGTRYAMNDPYAEMLTRGSVKPRLYPATHNGQVDGDPVYMTKEELAERRRDWGPYTYAAQMLQNPSADTTMGFRSEWVKYYDLKDIKPNLMNRYILVDPASSKKKSSDYTVMVVLGCGPDKNYYVLDMVRDRLTLTERAEVLFALHREWEPQQVGYEQYGAQCDIEHFEYQMRQLNYRFAITKLGGKMAKQDRILRLVPLFEQGKIWLPDRLIKTDYEHRRQDVVQMFLRDELQSFPVSLHDDMLDALSRLCDDEIYISWPKPSAEERRYGGSSKKRSRFSVIQGGGSAWAA